MYKIGCSHPENSHLNREQYGKLEDNQPGGTLDSRNRRIIQVVSLLPLLFVIIMTPLSLIPRDTRTGYQLKKEGCKTNHLLFMGDLKLYRKNSISLVQTVWSYSEDIVIKFGINNCAVLELERRRLIRSGGIEYPGWRNETVGRPGRAQVPWGTSARTGIYTSNQGECVHHNQQVEWIGRVKDKLKGVKQKQVESTENSVLK